MKNRIIQILPLLCYGLTLLGLEKGYLTYKRASTIDFTNLFHDFFLSSLFILYALLFIFAFKKGFPFKINWLAITFLVLWGGLISPIHLNQSATKQDQNTIRWSQKTIEHIAKRIDKNPTANLYIDKATFQNALFSMTQDSIYFNGAIESYEKAIGLNPANYGAYSSLLKFYKNKPSKLIEIYPKAIDAYKVGQQQSPENFMLYKKTGQYYTALGNLTNDPKYFQLALDEYNHLLNLSPSSSKAYQKRAALHEYFMSYDKAIKDYQYSLKRKYCNEVEHKIKELEKLKMKITA